MRQNHRANWWSIVLLLALNAVIIGTLVVTLSIGLGEVLVSFIP